MSDGTEQRPQDITAANLFMYQIVLRDIALKVPRDQSTNITRSLGDTLTQDIAVLMRMYGNNEEFTLAPRIAAKLQNVIDEIHDATDLNDVVTALIKIGRVKSSTESQS